MNANEIKNLIRSIAVHEGVNPELCIAIAGKESDYINSRCRFEKNWKYLVNPAKYALDLGITVETEMTLQKFSYSAMQVMGSVARELGFSSHLTDLNFPEVGLLFAVKKVKALTKKYPNEIDAISAYNQGNPRKDDKGLYVNENYVNNVLSRLNKLRNL